MAKILVVGGSGSLGEEIVRETAVLHQVHATYHSKEKESSNAKYYQLDITDKAAFEKLDHDYDAVLLISGAMPAAMEGYDPQSYVDVNISGALNVLEFCRKNNVKKVIYVMTFSDVAGSFYTGIPIKDDQERSLLLSGDHAVYSISKVAALDLLEHYHQEYGLQTIAFRIPTVYCADNNVNYYVDGALNTKSYVKMIRSVVQDNRIEVWGNPDHAKDMPYVKDFVRLLCMAVENEKAQGVYNAGTGKPISLIDFVDAVIKVFGNGEEVEKVYRPEMSSQPNFTFDMEKTKREFGYSLMYGVEDMLVDIKQNVDPDVWLDEDI